MDLSSFLEELILVLIFFLICFIFQHFEYIQDEVRPTSFVTNTRNEVYRFVPERRANIRY